MMDNIYGLSLAYSTTKNGIKISLMADDTQGDYVLSSIVIPKIDLMTTIKKKVDE